MLDQCGCDEGAAGRATLGDREQQLAIDRDRRRLSVAVGLNGAKHAGIAIEFHGEPQARHHPPRRRIPRHRQHDDARQVDEQRVVRRAVLLLVADHEIDRPRLEAEGPLRQNNPRL